MLTINLLEQVSEVEIPVYLLTGRHDYVAPYELVEAYYNQLEAPRKELVWFESSAHSPHFEEPELFATGPHRKAGRGEAWPANGKGLPSPVIIERR